MNKYIGIKGLGVVVAAVTTAITSYAFAAPPQTVVTIRPVHALVASVMDGVATPKLLLEGAESPHSYNLTPSDAQALSDAELVVWVGEPMETFLQRSLANLASDAHVIELVTDAGLALRDNREGAVWQTSGHSHAGRHDHDHEAEHNHDHDHAEDHDHGHSHNHEHDHEHHDIDGHVWLDPVNAKRIVDSVVGAMSKLDPENAALYAANASRTKAQIESVEANVRERLAPYQDQPFLTSHDSLQYFDQYFGLNAVGAVTLTPDRAPSARRVSELRTTVEALGAVCIFSEPGYEPRVIQVISEAADVRSGVVDPLGIDLPQGPNLYFELMTGLADDLADCLSGERT